MTRTPKALPILFATLLLDMVSVGIIFPVMATIFSDATSPSFLLHGYPQTSWLFIAGLVTGVFGVMQFIAAPILGELSDIYGRKKLLLVGVGVLAASQLCLGLGITYGSLLVVTLSRAIAGFAAANFSIAQAALADISTPETRAKNFGLIGAALGLGFIIGPFLGGWLSHFGTPATPFWFASVLGLLNTLFLYTFFTETRTRTASRAHSFTLLKGIHNIRAAAADARLRPAYLTNFVYMLGFTFFTSFSGIYLVERFGLTPGGLGTYFACVGVSIAVTQVLILPRAVQRWSEVRILSWTLLALALAFIAYTQASSVLLQYLLIPCIALPQGLSIACLSAFISKRVEREAQGVALGINASLTALGGGIAPLLGGAGTLYLGSLFPFYMAALSCGIAWWIMVTTPRSE